MLVPGCVSCEIVAGKQVEPGGVIYQNEHWHVGTVRSQPVVWPGFLIVKLKRHCEHLAQLTPQEAASLGPVIQSTCAALVEVLQPAKVYVCSFGDGVKHVHFWVLPRPSTIHPGMHSVIFQLDLRTTLTRWFRIKTWTMSDEEVARIASRLREALHRQP
jgi:diadenosine tetraphosphate (Ap4A) HIT family hydrolase